MKLFHAVIPNLAVSLNIALMIVIYLDMRNPMMGFLVGKPFLVLAISTCAASVASAVTLYATYRKNKSRKHPVLEQKTQIDP